MPIRLIFFDIDNTLLSFDAYVQESMRKGFDCFNLKKYEPWMFEVFTRENNRLWRRIETGEITLPQLERIRWNIIFDKLGIDFDGPVFEEYFKEALYDSAIPEDGALRLLEELSQSGRFILCAASNGPYDQQIHRLELADMKKYFDSPEYTQEHAGGRPRSNIFVSERIGAQKPAKEFFDYAFREINEGRPEKILPSECARVARKKAVMLA